MLKLSVIIITKNEQDNIRRCLESVKWASEIIVFDSGSDDDTVTICREYTNHIYQTDWPGFGQQKNRAIHQVGQEWVLSLDADEEVSSALQLKIKQLLEATSTVCDAYEIRRQLIFMGKRVQHVCGSDKPIRLFKRGCGQFSNVMVHEALEVNGQVGYLREPIWHYSFKNINQLLDKMNDYSYLGAKKYALVGRRSSVLKAITHGLWMFFRLYVIKRGFLDGRAGFILAAYFAEGTYYRYIKLMLLNTDSDKDSD